MIRRILLATSSALVISSASFAKESYYFKIPRGDLASVLIQIVQTTGQQIDWSEQLIAGRKAGPIIGGASLEDALGRALAGTGLEAGRSRDGAFSIHRPVSATGSLPEGADLAAIDVNDTSGGRYNDQGFQAGDAGETVRLGGAALREVPLTINVTTLKVIESQVITDPIDTVKNLPGVRADVGAGLYDTPNFVIRGFAADEGNKTVNGVSDWSLRKIPVDNIERVEVLKGPTSILTGQTARAGVVNIVTKEPTADRIRTLIGRYGAGNYKSLSTDLGGPVEGAEGLTFRFVGVANHAEENSAGYRDPRDFVVSPSLKWQGEALTVSGGLTYTNSHFGIAQRTVIPYLQPQTTGRPLRIPRGTPTGNPNFGVDDEALELWSKQSYDVGHVLGMDVTLNNTLRTMSDSSSAATTIYRYTRTVDAGPVQPFGSQYTVGNLDHVFENANLTAKFQEGDIKNTSQIGFDYNFERNNWNRSFNSPSKTKPYQIDLGTGLMSSGTWVPFNHGLPLGRGLPQDYMYSYRLQKWQRYSKGIYLVEKIDLFDDRLHIFGNVRYDEYRDFLKLNLPGFRARYSGLDTGVSWVAGGAFDLTPWMTIYGNRSNGFSPSANYNDFTLQMYPPEQRDLAEVGARYFLLDKKFTLTTSFFDMVRNNVVYEDPTEPLTAKLVKGMRNTGMEIEAQGEVLPGLNLIASYTIVNPQVLDKNSGIGLTSVPKHSGSLWVAYDFQDPALSGWTVGAGLQAVGRSFASFLTDPSFLYRIPGYVSVDAMIGYEKGDFSVNLKVNNLLDKYAYLPTPYANFVPILRGRNAMLQVMYKF